MSEGDKQFLDFLTETLIPDLHESGTHATAEDFERCVEIIKRLDFESNANARAFERMLDQCTEANAHRDRMAAEIKQLKGYYP